MTHRAIHSLGSPTPIAVGCDRRLLLSSNLLWRGMRGCYVRHSILAYIVLFGWKPLPFKFGSLFFVRPIVVLPGR